MIQWDTKYEVGVENIDLQHHYFLNMVNLIIEAIEQGKEKRYVEALVLELDAYARFHFRSEERLMIESGYPAYDGHKKLHFALIEELSIKQYKLINMHNIKDAEEVVDFLLTWFFEHTTQEDKIFAKYLLKKNRVTQLDDK